MENWKWIKDYEGRYEVSNVGRVRSYIIPDSKGELSRRPQIILKQGVHNKGYLLVGLFNGMGGRCTARVHRLVLQEFIGQCPRNMQAAHLDGDPGNNKLDNLQWVTPKENQHHRNDHGTSNRGERQWNSKLTANNVQDIRARLDRGELQQGIADKYHVCHSVISSIFRNKSWKHLEKIDG